ncbi:hypothetical protein EJD97_016593 [Solanum chilense]|uniref:Uncharacterized protein n=1 Tax=Solanum chilense TaxID=4083 RepID=A0A6N2B717_SOLCI|nr:hypothetical protein EJD97_016593 [Solanum chilense]
MQEQHEVQQTGQEGAREIVIQKEQLKNGNSSDQTAKNNLNTYMTPSQQTITNNKNKNTEVSGGMDGGCQEIATNLQEGATRGGNLPHVMYEGLDFDPRKYHRDPNKVQNKQKQREQQPQQQIQNREICQHTAKAKKREKTI